MQHGSATPCSVLVVQTQAKTTANLTAPVSVRPEPSSKKGWPNHTLVSLLKSKSSMGTM